MTDLVGDTNKRYYCAWVLFVALAAQGGTEGGWWSGSFHLPGVRGEVRAVEVDGTEIYLGGRFTAVGGTIATNLAHGDGISWSGLCHSMDGEINALAVGGGQVYAGGTFHQIDGINASLIARHDGDRWFSMGTGLQGMQVNALTLDNSGLLYAAGQFTNASGVVVANIACWDGVQWSALGTGLSNDPYAAWVWALAVRNSDLFAGGFFTEAGGVGANCIARWDGTVWHALGSGVDDRNYLPQVTALAVREDALFAGGAFASAGNVNASHVARWDGAEWSALAQGLDRFFGEIPVRSLALHGPDLVVGGRFDAAGGGIQASNLAVWNGSSWSGPGDVSGEIKSLAILDTLVVAGGLFLAQETLNNYGHWDGFSWFAPGADSGQGITGREVNALVIEDQDIFAGGTFTAAGRVPAGNIARWDGMGWSSLGEGVNGNVQALCRAGMGLYAGGRFTVAGGSEAAHIAQWDGTNWAPLGAGINGVVHALAWADDQLYAGGQFDAAGGIAAANVARWDGTTWHPLGTGCDGTVQALLLTTNGLYAAGKFRSAGGVAATNIALWDGTTWLDVGGGVGGNSNPFARIRPPPVSALAKIGDSLIVGGDFARAGAVNATNIARWDGVQWHALGQGIAPVPAFSPPPTVAALGVEEGLVLAGGTFKYAGETLLNNLALWDGSAWSDWNEGLGGPSQALVAQQGRIMAGGRFTRAGRRVAENFCIWQPPVRLHIKTSGDSLRISWPALTSEGVVNASDTLTPGAWMDLTNRAAVLQGVASVRIPRPSSKQFYRWKNQE